MTLHILQTPMTETLREPYGERWCFVCRARCAFVEIVDTPIAVFWCVIETREIESNTAAWYGATTRVECDVCHTVDGDCFPGTYREWND